MLRNRPFQSRLLKTAFSLALPPKAVSLTKNRLPTTTTTTEKSRKSHDVADAPKVSLSHAKADGLTIIYKVHTTGKADGLTMTKATFSLEQLRKFASMVSLKPRKATPPRKGERLRYVIEPPHVCRPHSPEWAVKSHGCATKILCHVSLVVLTEDFCGSPV